MRIDDLIPKEWRDKIIANDCSNKSKYDAAVGVSIEPLREYIDCRLDELFIEIFVGVLNLKYFVYGINKG